MACVPNHDLDYRSFYELGNPGCHKVANCTKTMWKLENTENWNSYIEGVKLA